MLLHQEAGAAVLETMLEILHIGDSPSINLCWIFEEKTAEGHFVIKGDYRHAFHLRRCVERTADMTFFNSQHRPRRPLHIVWEKAGFLVAGTS